MKKNLIIFLILSSFVSGHSAEKGDFSGTWRLVEYAINDKYQDVPNPTPIKMYVNGEFITIFYLEGKMQFNKGTYALKDKVVNETILSSSNESLIGETVSFRPNFMGDKKSYITTFVWDGVEYTHRWEKMSCSYEKCARISDFKK